MRDYPNVTITGDDWTDSGETYGLITMVAVLHHLDVTDGPRSTTTTQPRRAFPSRRARSTAHRPQSRVGRRLDGHQSDHRVREAPLAQQSRRYAATAVSGPRSHLLDRRAAATPRQGSCREQSSGTDSGSATQSLGPNRSREPTAIWCEGSGERMSQSSVELRWRPSIRRRFRVDFPRLGLGRRPVPTRPGSAASTPLPASAPSPSSPSARWPRSAHTPAPAPHPTHRWPGAG